MALMNLAATKFVVSSPPSGSVNRATATQRHGTWYRTTLETVGTFFVLTGPRWAF
jgi:hypothetical protein